MPNILKASLLVTLVYLLGCTSKTSTDNQQVEYAIIDSDTAILEDDQNLIYGFEIDSSDISLGKIKRNQNISEILKDYNVAYKNIHLLAQRSHTIYDVRKIKAGSSYTIIHATDSLRTAEKFIFEPSLKEYVIYHLDDSVFAEVKEKKSTIVEKEVAAEINSSLWNSIMESNASPLLVNKLVDVFAWQVDFFRIARGDKFKVIYEIEEIDGEVYDIRNIKGAFFRHLGKDYYAIPYGNEISKLDYFDKDGNSLRKTFLKAPLNYSRISSRYSLRRFHPVQKRYKAHLGTDYAAPTGTPIRTVGDGVVLEATYHSGNGNYVKVKHNSNYTTQYLHMSKIAKGIKKGQKVKQGETIGYVGSTGLATGPHLCFRFWKNGRQVDALKVDLPPSEGISKDEMPDFDRIKHEVVDQLDKIPFPKGEVMATMIPFEK